ncbi:hypothetical protein [Halobacillus halophilus]|nr:hypothetical protein [Halobacillus halophilus]MCA1010651.1 hypothetical protein [Halobacillus halophilus]
MGEDYLRKRVKLFIDQVTGKVTPPVPIKKTPQLSFWRRWLRKRASKDSL